MFAVDALPSVPMSFSLGENVEALSNRLHAGDAESLQQTAVEFESLFVSLLLKEMRQSLDGDGLFAGDQSDAYGGLFDMFLGRELGRTGSFGVSRMVAQYLQTQATS